MSDFSQIVDAIQAHVLIAIPGVTTEIVERIPDEIPASSWPFCIPDLSEEATDIEEFSQGTQRLEVEFAYGKLVAPSADADAEMRLMWTDLDAVRDRLHADRNLGTLVDGLEVILRSVPRPVQGQFIGRFRVQTRKGL